MQTLDYIFELDPISYVRKSEIQRDSHISELCVKEHSHLKVDINSSQVEYFLVSNKPYQQLSDHFGLSVNIKVEYNNSV
jgi:hypothetical protein